MNEIIQSENLLFPKKISKINEEISDIEKEINTLKEAKAEADEDLKHLHVSEKYNTIIKSS